MVPRVRHYSLSHLELQPYPDSGVHVSPFQPLMLKVVLVRLILFVVDVLLLVLVVRGISRALRL